MSAPEPSAAWDSGHALTAEPGAPVLDLAEVTAGYGRTTVLRDVSLAVPKGSVVALLGPNGAGKTTTLRVAAGLLTPARGEVRVGGEPVAGQPAFQRARRGLCLIPEGRGIFPNLTVRDNLRLQVPPWSASRDIAPALEAFPILADRLGQRAGRMSGGQQQMLALSRCFLADPSVVLLDEVSMGLAPRIIDTILEALLVLRSRGTALLLVEQYVSRALAIADHVYLLGHGRVEFSGPPSDLDDAELTRRYIGGDAGTTGS
jgi:branched-chain amino acid transport system ATP-binding protein